MRLIHVALIAAVFIAGTTAVAAEPPAPVHTRPYSVKCQASIQVWIEMDSRSLPPHILVKPEAKKRVSLGLVRTSSYRGDTVLCAYANRNREVTSSYAVHCLQPRKERGYRDSYLCQ